MVRTCIVRNCGNTSLCDKPTGNGKICLFAFPRDEELKEQWLNAVKNNLKKDRGTRSPSLFICEMHFEEDCFRRGEIEVLMDGNINAIKRKRVTLKSGSVPTIFDQTDEIETFDEFSALLSKTIKQESSQNESDAEDESTANEEESDSGKSSKRKKRRKLSSNSTSKVQRNKHTSTMRDLSPESARRAEVANHIISLLATNPLKDPSEALLSTLPGATKNKQNLARKTAKSADNSSNQFFVKVSNPLTQSVKNCNILACTPTAAQSSCIQRLTPETAKKIDIANNKFFVNVSNPVTQSFPTSNIVACTPSIVPPTVKSSIPLVTGANIRQITPDSAKNVNIGNNKFFLKVCNPVRQSPVQKTSTPVLTNIPGTNIRLLAPDAAKIADLNNKKLFLNVTNPVNQSFPRCNFVACPPPVVQPINNRPILTGANIRGLTPDLAKNVNIGNNKIFLKLANPVQDSFPRCNFVACAPSVVQPVNKPPVPILTGTNIRQLTPEAAKSINIANNKIILNVTNPGMQAIQKTNFLACKQPVTPPVTTSSTPVITGTKISEITSESPQAVKESTDIRPCNVTSSPCSTLTNTKKLSSESSKTTDVSNPILFVKVEDSFTKAPAVQTCNKSLTPVATGTNVQKLPPDSSKKTDVANPIILLKVADPLQQSVILPTVPNPVLSVEKPAREYSLGRLLRDWNSRNTETFPRFWTMYDNGSEGLLFGYTGDEPCNITRSILVKKDLTVEVRAHNRIANFHIIEKVSCLEDLRSAMISIMCLQLCVRASNGLCKNGFILHRSKNDKCKDCQITTRKTKENERCKELRLKAKKERQKKLLRNIKQKYSRSLKKIEALEEQVQELMARCSSQDDKILHNAMKDLPYCFQ